MLPKQKGAKYERVLKCQKTRQRDRQQTSDMTENRIKEEEKEEFRFLSAVSLLSFFFSFSTVFEKRTNFSPTNVFFFKGGFVQITCAISLHLGARALSSDDTLPEREREGKMSSTSASSEESAGGGGGRGHYGGANISSPASATPYYSHQSHILQHQVGVDFLSSFQLQQTQTQQNPAAQQTRGEQSSTKLSSPSSLSLSGGQGGGSGQQHAQSSSSPQLQQQQQQKATTTTTQQQSQQFFSHVVAAGWCAQAAENNQIMGELGMRAYFNPYGIALSGWDIDHPSHESQEIEPSRLNEFASIDDVHTSSEQEGGYNMRFHPDPDAREAYGGAMSLRELSDAIDWHDWNCRDVSLAAKDRSFTPPYLGLLRGYLNAYFLRLVEIGRVIQCFSDEGRAVFVAFHTGLLTKKEKNELYCVLQAREVLGGASGQTQRYQQHPYELVAFVTKDRLRDPNMPWNYIEPLMRAPDPAIFYDDPLDLVYDAHAALDVDASFWEQLDDLSLVSSFLPKNLLNSQYLRRISAKEAINRAERICKLDPKQAALTFTRLYGPRQPGETRMVLPLTFIDHESYNALSSDGDKSASSTSIVPSSSSGTSSLQIGNCALICTFMKSKRGVNRAYRAIGLQSLESAFMEARIIGSVDQPWLRRDGPKAPSSQLQRPRTATGGAEEYSAQFEATLKQLQAVQTSRAAAAVAVTASSKHKKRDQRPMSPGTPDGQHISYSYKYGAKRSPVSPVEIEEDEEARKEREEEEEEEEEEYVARSSERRAEMAYANALVPVTPGTGKPPLYGTVVAAAAKQAKMHEWIEPRSAIKKQQQQQKKRAAAPDKEDVKVKGKKTSTSRVATSAATAPSSGGFTYEGPKVNIPNLPENVLDEVYQAAGLDVSYSDIRDVKEMPEKDRLDYLKRQKNAHKLAEEIVLKELAPFGEIIDVTVRPTKHAADQMYAVVTFKKWYDLEAKETIESGGLFTVENFFNNEGKIVMRKSERDFGAPAKKKIDISPAGAVLGEFMGTKKMLDADEDVRPPVEPRSGWTKTKHSSISGQRLYQGNCGKCEKTCFVPFMPIASMPIPKCSQCMNEEMRKK